MHCAIDGHAIRGCAEAQDVRVETDVDVDVVRARLKQQGMPLPAELVGFHLTKHGIELTLDGGGRHGRIEDAHVWTEIRSRCCAQGDEAEDFPHSPEFSGGRAKVSPKPWNWVKAHETGHIPSD